MVCLGNEQRSFCHFWDCIQVLHFIPLVQLVLHLAGDWWFVLKTHCIANWHGSGMGILCKPFSWILISLRQTGVFRKCPLSIALQTASPLQVSLCSLEYCAAPEDQDSAKPCTPGHWPLLEIRHVPWALSSTDDSVGSGLRLEQSCQGSLSSIAWVLICYHWPPDANVLPFSFPFFKNCTILFMYLMSLNCAIEEDS